MNHHCSICGSDDAHIEVGHPVKHHFCDECFETAIQPFLTFHELPTPTPQDGDCIVSYDAWGTRVGIAVPSNN